MDKQDLRTIFNLADNPDDLSPVADHIVTTVREALAADQKVIVLAGEGHTVVSHVRLAEVLRGALHDAGIQKTAIAREQLHSFLEMSLSYYYPSNLFEKTLFFLWPGRNGKSNAAFRHQAQETLHRLKEDDAPRYQRLQALSHASWNWPYAPLVRHENFKTWLENDVPVHLIDAGWKEGRYAAYLDRADPETAEVIKTHAPEKKGSINAESATGLYLRNRFMAAKIGEIMTEDDAPSVLIVQTGFAHLGGNEKNDKSYQESLHSILTANTAAQNIRLLTLFPESVTPHRHYTCETILSTPAQAAMNNVDTIILRGLNQHRHSQERIGSFETEAATLSSLYEKSGRIGAVPILKKKSAYDQSRAAMKKQLTQEIKAVIAHYYVPG